MHETREMQVQSLGWGDHMEKDMTAHASILPWGIPHGGGNDSPLQHSCLGNPMDRGAWWATVHGMAKELDII